MLWPDDPRGGHCAIKSHRRCRDHNTTGIGPGEVFSLFVAAQRRKRQSMGPSDTPLLRAGGAPSGENTVVNPIGRGPGNVEEGWAKLQSCGLNLTTFVARIAARCIDHRTAIEHDRATRLQCNSPAFKGELAGIPLDQVEVTGQIAQRGSDPRTSVIRPTLPHIHDEADRPQAGIALQRGIRQFGTAHLQSHDLMMERHKNIRRTGHVDQGTGPDENLPPRLQKLRLPRLKVWLARSLEGPRTSADVNVAGRRLNNGARAEVNIARACVHGGAKRQS